VLQPGKLVEAKVVWIGETEVKVVVQNNGMEAIIPQVRWLLEPCLPAGDCAPGCLALPLHVLLILAVRTICR
jgi:hypothetical protein